jgi:hypothetical protein
MDDELVLDAPTTPAALRIANAIAFEITGGTGSARLRAEPGALLRFKIAAPPGVSVGETRRVSLLLEVDASLSASSTHQGEAAGACVEAQIDELRSGDANDATQPLRLTARSLAAPSQTLDPPAQYKLLSLNIYLDKLIAMAFGRLFRYNHSHGNSQSQSATDV